MDILVIGGTRFFGIPMIHELIRMGHNVTIASRGLAKDDFGNQVSRIILDRLDPDSMRSVLEGKVFDVVIDKIAYCSNDIRHALDIIECDKYIYMSTTAVYQPKHMDTKEEEFDGAEESLIWCDRKDFPYEVVKRQAEAALCQKYQNKDWIAVRYPFVIGRDDYTNRLRFYVEHIMKAVPMYIDNLDCQMGYIRSDEAGKFLAFLADKMSCQGGNAENLPKTVNGSSIGTISLREMISYVEKKTGRKAMIETSGDAAPYNGEVEYSINTGRAKTLGFRFTDLHDWIYELLDYYVDEISGKRRNL
ncbi:MAG: reductase [Lachnospiraceae bacterium]|nr:reductase [Lachnospiraceae bacterium]